jgi:hypothetical protein
MVDAKLSDEGGAARDDTDLVFFTHDREGTTVEQPHEDKEVVIIMTGGYTCWGLVKKYKSRGRTRLK